MDWEDNFRLNERLPDIHFDYIMGNPRASRLVHLFGVLSSSVHNAWMRTVAGRLELRYQYSVAIVYDNFPWPGGGLIETALPSPDSEADLSADGGREMLLR